MKAIVQQKATIHNRFDVYRERNGVKEQVAVAHNIVLNALWTKMLTPAAYFNYIFFGTGSGTLSASRTSLFTHLGYKSVVQYATDYDLYEQWYSRTKTIQLLETEYVGSELTEVGIAYGTTSTNLVTHAVLKDMNGNPISIEKTALDIITIYATVFVHWDNSSYDGAKIIVPNGNGLIQELLTGNYDSAPSTGSYICGLSFNQGGVFGGYNSNGYGYINKYYALAPTYSAATKKISLSQRLSAADGNLGGLRSVAIHTMWDTSFINPALAFYVGGTWYPHTSISGEAIGTGDGVTTQFATDFPFVKSGAKIYVDGVEQLSGVTVRLEEILSNTNFGQYLDVVASSDWYSSLRGSYWPTCNGMPYAYGGAPDDGSRWVTYENPFYATIGIYSAYLRYCYLYVSNDLENWTLAITANTAATYVVPETYRNYRYWKYVSNGTTCDFRDIVPTGVNTNNIVFETAPTNGAVITADYNCECIAKDVNHVFDFTFELVLGEKVS